MNEKETYKYLDDIFKLYPNPTQDESEAILRTVVDDLKNKKDIEGLLVINKIIDKTIKRKASKN